MKQKTAKAIVKKHGQLEEVVADLAGKIRRRKRDMVEVEAQLAHLTTSKAWFLKEAEAAESRARRLFEEAKNLDTRLTAHVSKNSKALKKIKSLEAEKKDADGRLAKLNGNIEEARSVIGHDNTSVVAGSIDELTQIVKERVTSRLSNERQD